MRIGVQCRWFRMKTATLHDLAAINTALAQSRAALADAIERLEDLGDEERAGLADHALRVLSTKRLSLVGDLRRLLAEHAQAERERVAAA